MRGSLRYNRRNKKKKGQKSKFKSGLEKLFASKLMSAGLGAEYEPDRFPFVKKSHYVPDFKIKENKYIETKGYFSPADRSKMLSFKEQYPQITIYIVFGNSNNYLSRKSETTYGNWATKHGFAWCDIKDGVPKEWWE